MRDDTLVFEVTGDTTRLTRNEDEKRVYQSKTYYSSSHPYAYATFTDLAPGKGLLQIHSDWGVFHSYWGAMGQTTTIEDFVLQCDSAYITRNLEWWMRFGRVKKEGFTLLHKFMIECWPKLREIIIEEREKQK